MGACRGGRAVDSMVTQISFWTAIESKEGVDAPSSAIGTEDGRQVNESEGVVHEMMDVGSWTRNGDP